MYHCQVRLVDCIVNCETERGSRQLAAGGFPSSRMAVTTYVVDIPTCVISALHARNHVLRLLSAYAAITRTPLEVLSRFERHSQLSLAIRSCKLPLFLATRNPLSRPSYSPIEISLHDAQCTAAPTQPSAGLHEIWIHC